MTTPIPAIASTATRPITANRPSTKRRMAIPFAAAGITGELRDALRLAPDRPQHQVIPLMALMEIPHPEEPAKRASRRMQATSPAEAEPVSGAFKIAVRGAT